MLRSVQSSIRPLITLLPKCTPRPWVTIPKRLVWQPLQTNTQSACFHAWTPLRKEQDPDTQDNVYKRQMLIGFTCKVCEERSHHTMSKHAYTKGVVLIQCPGCKNRHLIADNLGWFRDSKTTVEDLVKEKGEAIRKVIVDEHGVERLGDLMEWLPDITEQERLRMEQAKKKQ
ncbi:DNL zinc finger-domain-containing protein [Gilbertella persicaria]|uniref:DNL zinc finger-domain-containing protein n=1 Tax=Gilbertella persicaria TaxID=101096 RepID=UPI00221E6BF1|nr:DNL zinc finger-domain-containing protein [Gilbertella persicaria]KAI8094916.1 DNL zinc finger-domain-containing protein [Gilbertella persicaria]